MAIKFANNASTTLAVGISDSDTTMSVATGTGSLFPTITGSEYFLCTVVASNGTLEIVKVTARSTDTFTIVRAQEGTTAAAFSAGAVVENRMTAGSFNTILTTVESVEGLPTPADGEFIGDYDLVTSMYPSLTAAEMRTALGSTTVGDGVFTAATVAAAQQALDVEVGVDVQAYDAGTAKLDVAQEWTATQNFNESTLADAGTIAWNLAANQAALLTLGGNRTLDAPTNQVAGAEYQLVIKQDATGGRTLAFHTTYKFPGGAAPTITATASAVDVLTCRSDGTNMYCTIVQDFQ